MFNYLKILFSLIVLFATFGIIYTLNVTSITFAAPNQAQNEQAMARVVFKSPQSINDIAKLTKEKGLQLELVEGEFVIGSTPFYDWYIVKPGMDSKLIEEDYKNARLGYLQDLIDGESKLSQEQREALKTQFSDIKAAMEKKDTGPVVAKLISLAGDESAINSISKHEKVEKVNIVKGNSGVGKQYTPQEELHKIEHVQKKSGEAIAITAAAVTQALPSVPRYGRSDTRTSSVAGKRETTQYMFWENVSFAPNQTYEHEVFFEFSDGKSFLSSAETPPLNCFPIVDYAGTSFPASSRPFLDTRVNFQGQCDTNKTGELEFTIGAFQANQLKAQTWYQNYFRTVNGNDTKDRFRIGSQVGHKDPEICPNGYETWCSYGDSPERGDRRVDLLMAWNPEVPWERYWQWSVRFCEHNFDSGYGRCIDMVPGTHDLTEYNFNDILTTVRFGMGIKYRVTLYEHVNTVTNQCFGNGIQLNSGLDRWNVNLYENNLNFNDKASCAVVELQ